MKILRLMIITLLVMGLAACSKPQNRYGVPPNVWKTMTPEQRAQLVRFDQATKFRRRHVEGLYVEGGLGVAN